MAVRANDGSWVIHFGVFEADLRAGELRRNGSKLKLQEQPFQILGMLLERPGEIVTREELRARLWSADTFVDFDHGLNSAIRRLRDTLRVTAGSTVFRYKGKDADPREVGSDLHVRAVVSGRLLKRGSSLIIQAELIDVATGCQLWGGQYNRQAENVFLLQDDLSREISEKLRLRLTGDEKRRLTKRYTEDAEAYRLYLKGRYACNKRNPEGWQKDAG